MKKDIRRRYVGPCYSSAQKDTKQQFDIKTFIIRLLLFDTFILQTNRFIEFETLVDQFGIGNVKELLLSGAIKIHNEAHAVGQTGQTALGFRGKKKNGTKKELLPLNSFSFDVILHAEPKKIIHRDLQRFHDIRGIHFKEVKKLKRLIADNLVFYPKESTNYILNQTINDFKNNTSNIKIALINTIREKLRTNKIMADQISYLIEVDDENDVHVRSNLSELYNIERSQTHKIFESALLSIGGLNKRIETMRAFSAVTGFRENELPIFEDKLNFIQDTLSPENSEDKLETILSWPIFPNLDRAIEEKSLNIDKLLRIRESQECLEFRAWLWDTDNLDIEELKERLSAISAKLALKLSSKPAKAIRWLTTTGIGFLPTVGIVAGPVLGFLDSFLLEKLLPKSGVLTFLGKQYPTIYKGT